MRDFYTISSEQYSRIAQNAYNDYLIAKHMRKNIGDIVSYDSEPQKYLRLLFEYSDKEEDAKIVAVVFLAMAIESYANLMGAYLTDEFSFYRTRSREKAPERLPISEKLNYIFDYIHKSPPVDLIERIKTLFDKRNALVHQKPKKVSIDFEHDNIETIHAKTKILLGKVENACESLEAEIGLYDELKTELKRVRDANLDLIDEIRLKDEGEK